MKIYLFLISSGLLSDYTLYSIYSSIFLNIQDIFSYSLGLVSSVSYFIYKQALALLTQSLDVFKKNLFSSKTNSRLLNYPSANKTAHKPIITNLYKNYYSLGHNPSNIINLAEKAANIPILTPIIPHMPPRYR
jgi:hypothetical protein